MQKTVEAFDLRNEQKKKIEFCEKQSLNVRVGTFWRYFEGVNIGNEISKGDKFKRVCFVLDNNLGNGLLLVAPITTKYHKRMEKFYVKVESYEKYGLKECRIVLNQVKLIDKRRLETKTKNIELIGLAKKIKHHYRNLINK